MVATATLPGSAHARTESAPLRGRGEWPQLASGVLDLLEQGVFVVERDFTLLGVNRVGRSLLREGDGLRAVQHSLMASTPSASFELRRGIELTSQGETRRLQVPRDGRTPLALAVEPHPGKEHGPNAAVVFASDPERRRASGPGDVARRCGFTPTESVVAQQLAAGADLDAISQRLGITLNTVRGHLKHLYTKAGVHRQAELVAKLLAG